MFHSTLKSKFSLPVRVYFQDTDAGGVVYHANYVNFLERARTEWLRECYGYSDTRLMREFGIVFVVRSLKLDYLKPALLDDLLVVSVQLIDIGRSRVILCQNVQRDKDVLVESEIHLVCVTTDNFKPVSVPEVLREQWKNERVL
ncbi:tol-pal system-associated acyl-CoA thioesterase [Candidatus Nitrotoga sp. M5]|uniref:tol-pal system-associated acyl-CoA thioesterase n=1 Tax=Candidatus Nitrotoga sp. M5 TaxID=2890409 RepID=UPI001EF18C82|nr:tol-pal system-associated acyl-CoA thioesterase [Candidatus Nitrotoga sp. M5]CAH1386768.1 esterase/thioesterase [Candidatus Nitrotoga sp. M5]